MKKIILIFIAIQSSFAFGLGTNGNDLYVYTGRNTLTVKKEKLAEAKTLEDILPDLWNRLIMEFKLRNEIEDRRKANYSLGYYTYPTGGYETVVNYVSSEITVSTNGIINTLSSKNQELTGPQKTLIAGADVGKDIQVNIKFRFKQKGKYNSDYDDKVLEAGIPITVVPAHEAEYPGGFRQLSNYINEQVFSHIKTREESQNIIQGVVSFSIDQWGKVGEIKISRTTQDPKLDRLIHDAISKMPVWKPAQNASGVKVVQYFSIPMGYGGGC